MVTADYSGISMGDRSRSPKTGDQLSAIDHELTKSKLEGLNTPTQKRGLTPSWPEKATDKVFNGDKMNLTQFGDESAYTMSFMDKSEIKAKINLPMEALASPISRNPPP